MSKKESLYKYKIELHAHTNPASPCADLPAREVVRRYADAGVNGLAITNHFTPGLFRRSNDAVNFYLNGFREAQDEGRRLNVRVYLGAEMSFEEGFNDYLVYGIDEDFFKRAAEYFALGIKRFLKDFKGGPAVIIQAHPFRDGMTREPETDGAEVLNVHPNHNSRNALALAYAKKHGMLAVTGSDFHHEGHQARGLILSKALPADSFELAGLLKTRDYLFLIENKVVKPY